MKAAATVFFGALTTLSIFSGICRQVNAFITLPAIHSSFSHGDAAATYAGDGGGGVETVENGGNIAFQPHTSEESNDRTVYDPGDELLRALNAEMAANGQELGTLPQEPDYADTVYNELEVASNNDILRQLEQDIQEEHEIVAKSAALNPNIRTLPIVYVEETPYDDETKNLLYPETNVMSKRSRYYRRYPWKRHNRGRKISNTNSNYEPELRYACTPTKEDVFKLLVNLHENRKGNHSKTVNFCNRKRPAKAIFTNIRFLG